MCGHSVSRTVWGSWTGWQYWGTKSMPRTQKSIHFNGETPVVCSVSRTVLVSWARWQSWGTKSMPARKNPAILFQWRNSSGCDFLQGMAEFSLKDSITILGWRTVLRNKIYARMQKCCYFIWMEKLQWLRFHARNGRIQSRGQCHYPMLEDSPEEQNLCPHAKMLLFYLNGETPVTEISCKEWQNSVSRTVSLSCTGGQCWGTKSMPACKNAAILFQWRDSSGCDFLQGMAEFNLKDSITILGWMTVLRNKIYAHMEKCCYFIWKERFQWLLISCTKWQKSISRTASLS